MYYYYHMVVIDNANDFLQLKFMYIFNATKEQVREIHEIANTLIVSDEPYVVEIRRAILQFNPEEFRGGNKRTYKKRRTHKKREKGSKKRKGRKTVSTN